MRTTPWVVWILALCCFTYSVSGQVSDIWAASSLDQKSKLYVENGHNDGGPTKYAFSGDGKILVSCGGNRVRIASVAPLRNLFSFTRFSGFQSCAINRKGNLVAAVSYGRLCVWDLRSAKEIWPCKQAKIDNNSILTDVEFTPDDRFLATSTDNKTIIVWSTREGRQEHVLKHKTGAIAPLRFSYSGDLLACASEGQSIVLWQTKSWKPHAQLSLKQAGNKESDPLGLGPHPLFDRIWDIKFSKDTKYLGVAYGAGKIRVWDIDGRSLIHERSSSDGINTLEFLNDAPEIVYFDKDFVRTWNFKTGEGVDILRRGKEQEITKTLALNCNSVLVTNQNESSVFFDLKEKRILGRLSDEFREVRAITVSSKRPLLAAFSMADLEGAWDLTGGSFTWLKQNRLPDRGAEITLSPDESTVVCGLRRENKTVKFSLCDLTTGNSFQEYVFETAAYTLPTDFISVRSIAINDIKNLVAATDGRQVRVWDKSTGGLLQQFSFASNLLNSEEKPIFWKGTDKWFGDFQNILFSADGDRFIADFKRSEGNEHGLAIWDVDNWRLESAELTHTSAACPLLPEGIRHRGRSYSVKCSGASIEIRDLAFPKKIFRISGSGIPADVASIAVDSENLLVAYFTFEAGIRLVSLADNRTIWSIIPEAPVSSMHFAEGFLFTGHSDGSITIFKRTSGETVARIVLERSKEFTILTPDGRFDTSKSLDDVTGMHWIVNDEIMKYVPLDVFVRQYYEPQLLKRILRCGDDRLLERVTCDKEFKQLPAVAEINRVQARITKPKMVQKEGGIVDVVVEIESATEDVTIDANDHSKKQRLTSGAYDLRLFRDGQLVGTSASQERLQEYIDKAPAEVAKDQEAYRKDPKNASVLLNTCEDRLWRAANVIISNGDPNATTTRRECETRSETAAVDPKVAVANGVCTVSKDDPTKATCTFKDIKPPRDGRKEVEFSAYAFNADRVKSDTAKFTYQIPQAVSSKPQAGRAYLISIGVNASENPRYNLLYAANDAREMQRIVGEKLSAEKKYSAVVPISLISDTSSDPNSTAPNFAQKPIIRGVFSLLEGRPFDQVVAELRRIDPKLAASFSGIPKINEIKAVEPEDTLVITFSGHGYADQAGIFYLLPYDIGPNTTKLTPGVLRRLISSDELSLWMRGITATEMVMVIDACHSAAAVQGDGFKPGPMGSRGFGQLSYDKGMKILSATQADNVALELNSLQQGLLTYALVQEGIVRRLANTDNDKKLTTSEWLSYAVGRVPELYKEIKDGKRSILKDGSEVKDAKSRAELVDPNAGPKSGVDLQRPALFDFKKRNVTQALFEFR